MTYVPDPNAEPILIDDRPRQSEAEFMDDPRLTEVLANVQGLRRHRGQWRQLSGPLSEIAERLIFASRSIA